LKDADNVAIVLIEATIPKTGLRRGQKIDCYVSSALSAKSLRGGRLLAAPIETVEIGNDTVVGLASGPVYVDDEKVATNGRIPGGIILEEDFISLFVDRERNIITLLLDRYHASFRAAHEVAGYVNEALRKEAGRDLAKAIGPGVIEVEVMNQYINSPVEFVSYVLEIGIDNPSTQARVIIDTKKETVLITGDVEISPAVVLLRNLRVDVGNVPPPPAGTPSGPFVGLLSRQRSQSDQQVEQLLEALNQLRVPPADIISVIRQLHRSGKLHAIYEEY